MPRIFLYINIHDGSRFTSQHSGLKEGSRSGFEVVWACMDLAGLLITAGRSNALPDLIPGRPDSEK